MAGFNPLPDQLQGNQDNVGTPAPGLLLPPTASPAAAPDPTSSMLPMPSETQIQPNQAQQVDEAHHSMVGRLVKAVMGNQTQWQEQADGSIKEVPVEQKPGQLFRGMLLSGILGAGTQAHGFGEGFAKGASSAVQRGLDEGDKQRAQEVQNAQLREKKAEQKAKLQKYSDEHEHSIAAVAGLTVQTAHSLYLIHHMPADNIEHVNSANQTMAAAAYSAGGKDAQIVVDGKNINGQAANARTLEAAIKKNPNLATAGDSQHVRIPVYTTSMPEGAHVNDNGEWVDKASGKPIDPLDFTTVRLIDQPISSLTQMHTMTKSEVNRAVGAQVYKEGLEENVQLSQNDIMKLSDDAQKRAMEQGKLNLEKAQAARQNELAQKSIEMAEKNGQTALASLFKQQISSIDEAVKERQKADPSADVSDLQAQRTSANQQFIDSVSAMSPKVAEAMATAQTKAAEAEAARQTAVAQKMQSLQKSLPKAKTQGEIITPELLQQFADAYGHNNDKIREAVAKAGYQIPKSGAPGLIQQGQQMFKKFQQSTGPLVGVQPRQEDTDEGTI